MEAVAQKTNRRIVFTELGYKSTTGAAIKPWEWAEDTDQDTVYSPETQANCYQAFFDVVWEQPWFGGVHIWYFRPEVEKRGKIWGRKGFTVQKKAAEAVIGRGFAK